MKLNFVRDSNGRIVQREAAPPALEIFPAPKGISSRQRDIWEETLEEMSSEVFKKRHLVHLLQYCRLVECLDDLDPMVDYKEYFRVLAGINRLASGLGLTVQQEANRVRNMSSAARAAEKNKAVEDIENEQKKVEHGGSVVDFRKAMFSTGGRR